MPPQTRPRARSSVEHLFDLVQDLEDEQLRSFLEEINSTPHQNIDVSSGVAYFEEEQRRLQAQAHNKKQQLLRPTPSFLNAPPEPADWPRQKPRPVSGSQWRQSMRIVSAPYARHSQNNSKQYSIGGVGVGVHEPVSPPLTASPPGSPSIATASPTSISGPKRSVTAPTMGKIDVCVETRQVGEEPSPVSPPRHMLDEDLENNDHDIDSRPTFSAFRFGGDGAADDHTTHMVDHDEHSTAAYSSSTTSAQSSPVSPAQRPAQPASTITPPPEQPKLPEFSRMGTMPPLQHTPLSFDAAPMRPSTSAGPLAPRSFRRISRPVFLSPTEGGAEELAGRLSAFLFGGGAAADQVAAAQRHSAMLFGGKAGHERRGSVLMEEMLKEPSTPRGKAVFGKGQVEGMPVSGIFEVLTEG